MARHWDNVLLSICPLTQCWFHHWKAYITHYSKFSQDATVFIKKKSQLYSLSCFHHLGTLSHESSQNHQFLKWNILLEWLSIIWDYLRLILPLTRRHRSGSTLAQVMTCCLAAPSHYMNQCWHLVSEGFFFFAFTWGQVHSECTNYYCVL